MYGYPSPFNPYGSSLYGGFDAYGQPPGSAQGYGSTAMPDFRYRESAFAGNSSFTPPGGIRTGNGMIDMGLQIGLMSAFPGQEFRPFQAYDGADIDYLRGRGRANEAFKAYREQAGRSGILPPESELGKNPIAQMATENLKYGGSTQQAFQSAYGRFGNIFGDSPEQGAKDTARLLSSMDDAFAGKGPDGKPRFDYDKSFGFNRQETVENVDSALRFGVGGMSRRGFAQAAREGRGGEYAAQANETTRLGKSTFGQDQSADQINDLLDKATGGIANVTPEKASEFLAKVQSTARALDINAKAFAEYIGAQQKMYKEMGIGGSVAADMIMSTSLAARGASDRARETGDIGLSDQNRGVAALNANAAVSQGSSFMKQLRFVAAQADRMNADEDRDFGVDGKSLKANLQAIDAMKAAGNGAGAEALFDRVRNRFGADLVAEGGLNLSEEDAARSQNIIKDTKGSDLDAETRTKALNISYQRARGQRGFDEKAVSRDVYGKAVENLGAMELQDPAKVAAALEAQGVEADAARSAARALSVSANVAINNTANFVPLGRRTQDQVRASLDQTRTGTIEENAAVQARESSDEVRARNLNRVMGSVTGGVKPSEEIGRGISAITEEIQKGGKVDGDRIKEVFKGLALDVTQTDKLTRIQQDYESGAMSRPDYQLPGEEGAAGKPDELLRPWSLRSMLDRYDKNSGQSTSGDVPPSAQQAPGMPGQAHSTASVDVSVPKEQLEVTKKSGTVLENIHLTLLGIAKGRGPTPMANAASNTGLT
jgi:hypothetical protein